MTDAATNTCPIGAVDDENAAERGCAPKTFDDEVGCEVHGRARDVCLKEHDDWTGPHERVSSCPDPVMELIGQIMTANYDAMTFTMNQLYAAERRRALAFEVWHHRFIEELTRVQYGTVREYELVIDKYQFLPYGCERELELARTHESWNENDEESYV